MKKCSTQAEKDHNVFIYVFRSVFKKSLVTFFSLMLITSTQNSFPTSQKTKCSISTVN